MGLAAGIRKRGFRKWHERELLSSHGWLVLTLLCAVASFFALESMIGNPAWSNRATNVLAIFVSGAVGVVALRRFLHQLVRAQTAASQAVCTQCGTYGRLAVVTEDRAKSWLRVRCRNCAHEWVMDDS